ncbi:MAG: hypothetical protein VXY93_11130, partial [Pseudomonadota bacterium]|nr:hypothetical protein [Pseudomonadota bacterium]
GVTTFSGIIEGVAGENKIPSLYAAMGNLPSAGSYHGMFAHVHATGRGYFAHAGNWLELVNKEVNGVVGTGTESYNIGIITATGADINGDLDVDGHTNLDNVSIAGVTTVASDTSFIIGSNATSKYNIDFKQNSSTNRNSIDSFYMDFKIHDLQIRDESNNSLRAYFWPGEVALYSAGGKKFSTIGSGIKVHTVGDGHGIILDNTTYRNNITAESNRPGAVNSILEIDGKWNNTQVAFMTLSTGDDTTNKDDGRIRFFTKPSGGTIAERVRIESDGKVGIGSDSPRTELDVNGDVTVGSGGENSALGVRVNSAYAQIKLPDGQTGANRKGNLSFGDNDDFRIVHDGHHNYITAGTGDIFVSTSSANPVNIRNSRVDLNVDLTLTDTATDSAAGPEFKLFRNSASPADADYIGQIKFAGESDTGVERNYAKIT